MITADGPGADHVSHGKYLVKFGIGNGIAIQVSPVLGYAQKDAHAAAFLPGRRRGAHRNEGMLNQKQREGVHCAACRVRG